MADRPSLIHQRFREQARRHPDRAAVEFLHERQSYAELWLGVEAIARALRANGLGPGSIIGVLVEPSPALLCALYGVLYAGAAFVPIDQENPRARIELMLDDSSASSLITSRKLGSSLLFTGTRLYVEEIGLDRADAYDELAELPAPHDPAYLIYTSGSTGEPKGVVVEHANISSFAESIRDAVSLSPDSAILAATSTGFDIFLLETLLPLAFGMTLVLADADQRRDPKRLSQLIAESRVAILQLTPSRLGLLASQDPDLRCLRDVRVLLLGGEVAPPSLLERALRFPDLRIFNLYGPTEATIWCTSREVVDLQTRNIGRPLGENLAIICDDDGDPVPAGMIGELCIAGPSVARGYHNRDALTHDRFKTRHDHPGVRLYRTGDRACWTQAGELEFHGRSDNQIKIHGARVSLEEIEVQLTSVQGVQRAAVVKKQHGAGDEALYAYYVGEHPIEHGRLRESLEQTLPPHMVPVRFIQLESLPISSNGKLDRHALPEPTRSGGWQWNGEDADLVELLIQAWALVLDADPAALDVHQGFFDLGGDSLKAALLSEHCAQVGINLSLYQLYRSPTISELADSLLAHHKRAATTSTAGGSGRRHTRDFAPSRRYPFYFDCYTACSLEALGHNVGIRIPPNHLSIANGGGLFGYFRRRGKSRSWYRFDFANLFGMRNVLISHGLEVSRLTFGSFDEHIQYFEDTLARGQVAIALGSTYHLKHTKDYRMHPDAWLGSVNKHVEDNHVHGLLIIDIAGGDCLVFDPIFDYYGPLAAEDLALYCEGLHAISFMRGHRALQSTPPFQTLSVDWRGDKTVDRQVAQAILDEQIKQFTRTDTRPFVIDNETFDGVVGLEALRSLSSDLARPQGINRSGCDELEFLSDLTREMKEANQLLFAFLLELDARRCDSYCQELELAYHRLIDELDGLDQRLQGQGASVPKDFADRLDRIHSHQTELYARLPTLDVR